MSPKATTPAARRPRVRRGNEQDADRLRAEMLGAAMRQFAAGGVAAVSMRGIAGALGVSVMTPYRYFPDKAALLSRLGESVIRGAFDRMAAAIAAASTGREMQRASIDAFLGYWEAHPDHYRLVYMTEQATGRDPASNLTQAPVYGEILDLVAGVTRALAAELGVDETHARIAGDVRFMMQLGYLHATLVNRRFPWSARQRLRAAYIEEILAAVERCLRGEGLAVAPAPRRRGAARA